MTRRLEGKVALITGAARGIGRAQAVRFAQEGADIVALDVCGPIDTVVIPPASPDDLAETARLVAEAGSRIHTDVVDVRDLDAVRSATDAGAAMFGGVDVVCATAGITTRGTALELSSEAWRTMLDVNLTGPFLCTQEAIRLMKSQTPQGGRIINNGSISAHAPRPGSIAYTATKHAITGLTRAAALDGRPFDIAVGQIDIGNAASEMTARMVNGVLQADGSTRPEPRMDLSAVSETFMAMVRLPLTANVLFTTVMATKMPYVGRG